MPFTLKLAQEWLDRGGTNRRIRGDDRRYLTRRVASDGETIKLDTEAAYSMAESTVLLQLRGGW